VIRPVKRGKSSRIAEICEKAQKTTPPGTKAKPKRLLTQGFELAFFLLSIH